jgi:hypothetical protein
LPVPERICAAVPTLAVTPLHLSLLSQMQAGAEI